jgi:uncharacterized protein YneF (UPF0154 family)
MTIILCILALIVGFVLGVVFAKRALALEHKAVKLVREDLLTKLRSEIPIPD